MARPHRRPARHDSPTPFRSSRQRLSRTLRCEPLEDRRLLATITVDLADDLVDFNDGRTSLREAIFAANTVPGADEIWFDFGHDGPVTLLLTQGELAITDAVSIIGAGAGLLTIDGQLQSRLFNVGADAGDVTFRGVTLTRGQTTGDNTAPADALNQTYSGGAIRSMSAGLLTLDQVDVLSNATTGEQAAGGALYVTGPLAISYSKVRGNVASGVDAEGGGLFATGEVIVAASTFSGNRGTRGGGVSSRGVLTIAGSTFNGNRAVDWLNAAGGAIYSTSDLNLVNSTISTNAAQGAAASRGGGIWIDGAATIAHSTIIANTASTSAMGGVGSGGGLYSDQSAGETLTITHTIIGGNLTTEENGELRLGTAALTLHYSLIADNDGTNIAEAPVGWADANGNLVGGVLYGYIDPLLDGLEENGGLTRTHALLPGSPALFAGDPLLVPGVGGAPEFDQRGEAYSRRPGTRPAIGAVESNTAPYVVDSLGDESDGDFGPGELTLREALELANGSPGYDAIEFAPSLFAAGPQRITLTNDVLRISDDLELRGPGAAWLTIDASGNNALPYRPGWGTAALVISDGQRTIHREVQISGLSVTGAEQSGIRSEESLTLIGVDVYDNYTSGAARTNTAGGIEAFELFLIASRVFNNDSLRATGGIYATGETVIDRSVVNGNGVPSQFEGAPVGGLNVRKSTGPGPSGSISSLTIMNSDISGNWSSDVGGIRSDGFSVWMVNSNVSANFGKRTGGASLQNIDREVGIWNSSIVHNSSLYDTAGIKIGRGSVFTVAVIENSTISNNGETIAYGGGAGLDVSVNELTIRHSTIASNAREGLANSSGRVTVEHSLITGNGGSAGSDLSRQAGMLTLVHSIVGYAGGSGLIEAPVGSPDSNGNLIGGPLHGAIDPLLAPLADNGGPRLAGGLRLLTSSLLPGSPAIDAGDPTLTAGEGETPTFDQRGEPFARVAGRRIDIGAVELQKIGSALGADFTFDGIVDGADFLAWQRGFGAAGAIFDAGDATADGVVDGADLSVWAARYGDSAAQPSPGVAVAPTRKEFVVEEKEVDLFSVDRALTWMAGAQFGGSPRATETIPKRTSSAESLSAFSQHAVDDRMTDRSPWSDVSDAHVARAPFGPESTRRELVDLLFANSEWQSLRGALADDPLRLDTAT